MYWSAACMTSSGRGGDAFGGGGSPSWSARPDMFGMSMSCVLDEKIEGSFQAGISQSMRGHRQGLNTSRKWRAGLGAVVARPRAGRRVCSSLSSIAHRLAL